MSPFLNIAVPAFNDAEPSEPSEPPQQRARSNQPRLFAFTIRAAAEPETVPRLISPFAKRGLVPKRFSARAGTEPGWLTVWVEAELPDDASANSIAGNLRGILCVDAVLLEETRRLPRRRERTFGAFAAG
ncbi:MAG: hypothetical protein AAFY01_09425 [Pseudomonadota bacterium]